MANTSTAHHAGKTVPEAITPETLPVITHAGKPVVTTASLARLYGTVDNNLIKNFQRNAARFDEGKHYHRLEGEELRALKHCMTNSHSVDIPPQARSLLLWTERGAARHAKMLDTDAAWDVFEVLEDCYFSNAGPEALQTITDTYRQVAFEGCRIRVWMRDGQPWFAAANVATALGLPSSDRITRSAHPNDVCRTMKGKQATNYMSQQLARRAADYAKPELGERWLVWLQRTLAELAPSVSGMALNAAEGLSAVQRFGLEQMMNTRLLLSFRADGGLDVKPVDPEAMLITPDRLATVIGDHFVIGQQHLPEILSAVAGRMRCGA